MTDDVIARYYFESTLSQEEAARAIAAEQSTGTWTEVGTASRKIHERLGAKVIEAGGNQATIAFPNDLFEPLNLPQYLSVVAGNLFGLGELKNVRLLEVDWPENLVGGGPEYGIQEAREFLGVMDRPLVGTIIKPKVGLNPQQTAQVAYEAASGGLDLIKDDETLTDQGFCPIYERVEEVMSALDRAERETGEKTFYAVNVTSGADEIVERAEEVRDRGANMVMVDVLTAGFSALQALNREIDLPIHVHRTMHAAITRNPRHGIAMPAIAQLVRIAGGTSLHTGTYHGKMHGAREEVDRSRDLIRGECYGLKPMFPVASGGVHPGLVEDNLEGYGRDVLVQAGGGVHGHPDGTRAGARAMRQAADAWMRGQTAAEYAKSHEELRRALGKWGSGVKAEY